MRTIITSWACRERWSAVCLTLPPALNTGYWINVIWIWVDGCLLLPVTHNLARDYKSANILNNNKHIILVGSFLTKKTKSDEVKFLKIVVAQVLKLIFVPGNIRWGLLKREMHHQDVWSFLLQASVPIWAGSVCKSRIQGMKVPPIL